MCDDEKWALARRASGSERPRGDQRLCSASAETSDAALKNILDELMLKSGEAKRRVSLFDLLANGAERERGKRVRSEPMHHVSVR